MSETKCEQELRMPEHYGKYPGKKISELPNWYLKWVAENWSEKTEKDKAICKAADKEYTYRQKFGIEIK